MATSTINITLPEELQPYVDAGVEYGSFGTPTQYVRDLILNDRDRRRAHIEEQLIEALKGPFIEITDEEWEHGDIMAIAEERFAQLSK